MSVPEGSAMIVEDVLDPARAAALHETLGLPGEPPRAGAALPPMWHRIHFWEAAPPAMLGPDGHPRPGAGVIPDMGLPRRMWAGGRLEWRAPLILGRRATRSTRCESATRKEGRRGPFALVQLVHEYAQDGALCLREVQDLAYLPAEAAPPAAVPPVVPDRAEWSVPLTLDAPLLFRYSALTFNGHRIHYDADYARQVEGYGGLVVHGPLLAHHLAALACARLGRLGAFRYRATAPLILGEAARLCARARPEGGLALWVEGPAGRLCMEAQAA
ncbi:MAG: acyl dehydratase [Rhodobacteraceae bacterium]|nr:acyl dehydratase [Paracoccaceae bacterium]